MDAKEKFNKIGSSFKKYDLNTLFEKALLLFLTITISLITYYFVIDDVNTFIEKHLLIEKEIPLGFDVLFQISYLLIFIRCIKFSKDYKYTFKQFLFFSTSTIVLIFYSYKLTKFKYLNDSIFNTPYVYYLNVIIALPVFSYLYHKIIQHFINPCIQLPDEKSLLLDIEIQNKNEDELDYDVISNKLYNLILKNNFIDSTFSVGIVSPWGHGKSSFLNIFQEELKKMKPSSVVIKFSPSINHKENEIINEFISVLNENLNKYSAKLSPKLIEYTQHLTNSYNNKNILGLFSIKQKVNISKSASELFDEINLAIQDIGKKIIILIDDLDRLEPKEILQVFKIIRNTASFKNTVFVIGIDKEYTLERLLKSGEIHNSAYLNKFFQLEVHLPLINKDLLKEYFFNNINQTILSVYKKEVLESYLEDSNFNNYIYNYRDVKRLLNQLHFDYNADNEILFNEFIDLTLLKINFPDSYNWILKNLENHEIFNKKEELYHLIEFRQENQKESDSGEKSLDVNIKNLLEDIDFDFLLNKKVDISSFYITKLFFDKNSKLIIPSSIQTNKEKVSFLVLLISLFSDKTKDDQNYTIQNYLNLKQVFENKVYKDKLTNKEFIKFIEDNKTKQKLDDVPDFLNNPSKTKQYIEKINLYSTVNQNNLEKGIRNILLSIKFNDINQNYLIKEILFKVIQLISYGGNYDFKIKDNKDPDFRWFISLLDEVNIFSLEKISIFRLFVSEVKNENFKLNFFFKDDEELLNNTKIKSWLSDYYANFYDEIKDNQQHWWLDYYYERGLIEKADVKVIYEKHIKANPLEFTKHLIVGHDDTDNYYKINENVLKVFYDDFSFLNTTYKDYNDIMTLLSVSKYYNNNIIINLKEDSLKTFFDERYPHRNKTKTNTLIIQSFSDFTDLNYFDFSNKMNISINKSERIFSTTNDKLTITLNGNIGADKKVYHALDIGSFNISNFSESDKTIDIFDEKFKILYSSSPKIINF